MPESRVLRKSGNSAILTVPTEVMEALGVNIGENISYVIENDSVKLVKEKSEMDNLGVSKEFIEMVNESFTKYEGALRELADK